MDDRLTLAIPEHPHVVERHKGLWITAAARMTGVLMTTEDPEWVKPIASVEAVWGAAVVAGPRGLRLLGAGDSRYRPVALHRPVVQWSLPDVLQG